MENLPFDILPPVRIFPLWFAWGVRAFLLLMVISAVFAVIRYLVPFFKNLYAPELPAPDTRDISESISRIRDDGMESAMYRECLLALSALVKSFLGWRSGKEAGMMESSEIRAALGEPAGEFFSALELKSFSMGEPSEADLDEMCSKALRLVAEWKGSGRWRA